MSIIPTACSLRSDSRMVGPATENRLASSWTDGRRSPGSRPSRLIRSTTRLVMWLETDGRSSFSCNHASCAAVLNLLNIS